MALTRSRPLRALLIVVLGLAGLEVAARVLVAVAPGVLPEAPPAALGRNLDNSGLLSVLRPDRQLLFALRANADGDFARSGAFDQTIERFHVHINEDGYRTPPFATAKTPGVTRIVCLGDAVTFGAFVDDEQTYARQLAARLEGAAPGRYEVINLGVPGYTSRQGIELLRRQVLALDPDLVLFAFGQADRTLFAAESDDARIQSDESGGPLRWLLEAPDHLVLLRLLGRLVGSEQAAPLGDGVPRGSLDDIAAAIVGAQEQVQATGGRLVVLNADFAASDAMEGIRAGVQRSGADFVDLVGGLKAVANERSAQIARQRNLPRPQPQPGTMTFRVEAPQHFEVWLEVVRGAKRALVPMHDDGTGGDQVAHDDIFTLRIEGRPGERLTYTYRGASVLGPVREFTHGEKVNRSLRQVPFNQAHAIIDRFGVATHLADPNLPDAEGHATIAQVLAAHIMALASPAAPAAPATPAP